jgi:hypothetical protein
MRIDPVVQPGTYLLQSLFALVEPVEVPFGTFDAIQMQTQLDLSIEVEPGVVNDVRVTQRIWLVPGLGLIRSETTLPTGTGVFELVDTNRVFVPEPSASLLQFSALTVLVALRVRRRGHTEPHDDSPSAPHRHPESSMALQMGLGLFVMGTTESTSPV